MLAGKDDFLLILTSIEVGLELDTLHSSVSTDFERLKVKRCGFKAIENFVLHNAISNSVNPEVEQKFFEMNSKKVLSYIYLNIKVKSFARSYTIFRHPSQLR